MALQALTTPLAMVAQFTMPPNTLTRMALTLNTKSKLMTVWYTQHSIYNPLTLDLISCTVGEGIPNAFKLPMVAHCSVFQCCSENPNKIK